MPDIRITSDPHLGHPKVAELRGFDSVEAHDDTILRNLARGATDKTLTWILGDVVFGSPQHKLSGLARLRDEVPGHKRLVLGNHDPLHPAVKQNADWGPWLEVFEQIHTAAQVKHDGHTLLLSHFPYDGDNDHRADGDQSDRFEQYRLRDLGAVLLHGHTHASTVLSTSAAGTPMVHVGLDAHQLRPVPLGMIPRLLAS